MGRKIDYTLDVLLEWDGIHTLVEKGCWVKTEAKLMEADEGKPFGIKYSLTLHDPQGERVLGYDNAHAIPNRSYIKAHDHMHKSNKIVAYEYVDAEQLLHDFWNDVGQFMRRIK